MNKEEIRNKLLQELKEILDENSKGITQMGHFVDCVRKEIDQNTPIPDQESLHQYVFEIVNEWVRAGVLFFGRPDDPNTHAPWLTITEFGRECLQQENLLPYDPDGFVRELQNQVPSLDGITLMYLRESISTYNSEYLLSSTITLGVASEHIMLTLIEAFSESISDPSAKQAFKRRIAEKSIYKKHEEFRRELDNYKTNLPQSLTRDLEVYLDQIFQFIRINRNQAGHPTGQAAGKKVAYSNLQIFAEYSKRIIELIEYFDQSKI